MRVHVTQQIQFDTVQFAGKPLYFFDISLLRSSVASLIGWSPAKLEAAIAPRVENAIGETDLWFTTPTGFFVIFASIDQTLARTQAKSICVDILKHFYGQEEYPPEYADKFCRPSSTQDVARAVACSETTSAKIPPMPPEAYSIDEEGSAEIEKEQRLFRKKCIELFRAHVLSNNERMFLFLPCWDTKRERITSFTCGDFETLTSRRLFESCGAYGRAGAVRARRDGSGGGDKRRESHTLTRRCGLRQLSRALRDLGMVKDACSVSRSSLANRADLAAVLGAPHQRSA